MLGVLERELPELPIYCVLADTGFEHQTPISAESWVRIRCEPLAHPVPLSMVRNPKKTYLEMVERRGRFPSAQYRQCTSDAEAWAQRAIHSLTGIQGRYPLHGNSRRGIPIPSTIAA
jgi:hypothetical protein